jgi:glycosyltransferase involved in cell wall biosynthesis
MVALTIGMATFDDFDGVYFTLQALRLYQDLDDTELLVVDNFGCAATKEFVESWAKGRYVLAKDVSGTAAPRDRVFREASGDAVLCCDSHVLFTPGVIARLKAYYRSNPDCVDLLQGPLVYDDATSISTHFDPTWRDQMWGTWATDPQGEDPEAEPFDIPMQGLGAFSCRRSVWPGFNPAFRGFGGEEGYIHEKFRQRGGRSLCLPWMRWMHRFGRPKGVPYPLTVEDKLRNYLIGHSELGLNLTPVLDHFAEHLPPDRIRAIVDEAIPKPPAPAVVKIEKPGLVPSDDLPLISCICPTYNRCPGHQHLLEEAIESFLRQTYPNKELIVLNDCPGQTLTCNAPGVRVVNAPERYRTLGEKLNAAVRLSGGKFIARWDDDDISLPWRLSLSVKQIGDADYFNAIHYWFLDGNGFHDDASTGVGHNASLFLRTAFELVGGYPDISCGQDQSIDQAFLSCSDRVVHTLRGNAELPIDAWYYIYRWGVSPAHLSGGPAGSFYEKIGTMPVAMGSYDLHPQWRSDYTAETRRLLYG